jgi:NAD(P)-dependent dehydrogenase (short-subunit alcohol dehydrogenase family)
MFPSVSDSQQIQDALKAVLEDFGKIDVYVANAGECSQAMDHGILDRANKSAIGMAISKPILEQTLEEYRKQMSVNGK